MPLYLLLYSIYLEFVLYAPCISCSLRFPGEYTTYKIEKDPFPIWLIFYIFIFYPWYYIQKIMAVHILWSFLLRIALVTHGEEIDFFTIFLYVSVIIIKIKFKGYWLVFWGMRDLFVFVRKKSLQHRRNHYSYSLVSSCQQKYFFSYLHVCCIKLQAQNIHWDLFKEVWYIEYRMLRFIQQVITRGRSNWRKNSTWLNWHH